MFFNKIIMNLKFLFKSNNQQKHKMSNAEIPDENLENLIETGEVNLQSNNNQSNNNQSNNNQSNNNQSYNKENYSLCSKIKRKIIIFCCINADTIISYVIGLLICLFIFLYLYIKI